jgi:ribosome-binding protein aMBF1 (putative translation factor)
MNYEGLLTAIATLGWSQRDLARDLGKNERTVRRYCSGTVAVPADVAAHVQALLAWHAKRPAFSGG